MGDSSRAERNAGVIFYLYSLSQSQVALCSALGASILVSGTRVRMRLC